MLPLLPLLFLCIPSSAPQAHAQEEAISHLESAIAARELEDIVLCLHNAKEINDIRVLKAANAALKHPNPGIKSACLEALRFQPNQRALLSLHALFSETELLAGNAALHAQLLRATGQRAHASSVSFLAQGAFTGHSDPVLRARIFALGNLPSKGAIEVLMLGLGTLSPARRLLHMDAFRLALVRQTDVDYGMDADGWLSWWENNREDVRAPTADVSLPAHLVGEWNGFWSVSSVLPLEKEAPKRTPKKTEARANKQKATGPRKENGAGPAEKTPAPHAGESPKNPKAEGKGKGKGKEKEKARGHGQHPKHDGAKPAPTEKPEF